MLLSLTHRDVQLLTYEDGVVCNDTPPSDYDFLHGLDQITLDQCMGLRDWLINEAVRLPDLSTVIEGIAQKLNTMGVPVDRMTTAVEYLHCAYAGIGRYWSKQEQSSTVYFPHEGLIEALYRSSPIYYVHQTREWLHLDLSRTPDTLFSVIPDLKLSGYTFYICIPIFFANGSGNSITFATNAAHGFTQQHMHILRFLMPIISIVMELRATIRQLDDVLRIYVGDEPHRAILSGVIRRGQVSRIRSAILVVDMRDYTRISSKMSPEQTVALLNDYFDYIVPPIEAQGGQVLKYMGDALLAIFRDETEDTGTATRAALNAAIDMIHRISEARCLGSSLYPVEVGIALHHGEAAYGNVGAGQRLDFTVIGRDVNIACRVAKLNKALNAPILMTKTFAHHIWQEQQTHQEQQQKHKYVGDYALEGIDEKVQLYTPNRAL